MYSPGTSTQWPSQLNLAASFDPALAYDFGVAIGVEWWKKGVRRSQPLLTPPSHLCDR